jgi:predicted nucleic acid-binding protein
MSSLVGRRWVVNASPLIILGKVGRIGLLEELTDELVIPGGVAQEVDEGPEDDPARVWISAAGAPAVRHAEPLAPVVAAWDLGAGESAVLSWAHRHPDFEAILDDRAARNCAASLSILVRGTLGVILLAKKEGRVPLAAPVLQELRSAGLRISDTVWEAALRLTGE